MTDPVMEAVSALRVSMVEQWRNGFAWGRPGDVPTYALKAIAETLAEMAEPDSVAHDYVRTLLDALDAAVVERATAWDGDVTILVKMRPAAPGARVTMADTLKRFEAAQRLASSIAERIDITGPPSIPIGELHKVLMPADTGDA